MTRPSDPQSPPAQASNGAIGALERAVEQIARYKYALDQASIVAVTDVKGRITFVNDKFCEISKYTREELLGQDHRILNSAHHPKAYIRELWRTIATGRVWRGELRNRAKDGTFYWVDTTIVPFLDERGKPEEYLAIRTDITERKHIEAQLRQRDTLAQLGQMAAIIAHEVKNPLAGISGAIQVISSRMSSESRDAQVLKEVIARIGSLNEVLGGLLEFARPPTPLARDTRLDDFVQPARVYLRDHPSYRFIRFSVSGEGVRITGDPTLLGRAVLNLVINAAQAHERPVDSGPPMGSLAGEAPSIHVDVSARKGEVVIAVRDNGPGMDATVMAELFRPFFTTKVAGTGLGLSIVKQTAEAHGGRVEVQSEPGRTTFSVILPRPATPSP